MASFRCDRHPEGHIRTAAGIVHFRAGKAQVDDPGLADALRQVPAVFGVTEDGAAVADSAAPPAGSPPADVPDGTAKDVLDWVGDDPDRARQALDAEQGREKPRSTLVATLTRLTE